MTYRSHLLRGDSNLPRLPSSELTPPRHSAEYLFFSSKEERAIVDSNWGSLPARHGEDEYAVLILIRKMAVEFPQQCYHFCRSALVQ